MTSDEFKDFVTKADARSFVVHRLFDDQCWLFDQPALIAPGATYTKFKAGLADLLAITPREIAIVGSAKFGWSMSPKKRLRAFDAADSDIDIAIVSRPMFDQAWDALRAAYYAGYSHYKERHAYHIFARSLVLDGKERYRSVYLQDLAVRLAGLNAEVNQSVRLKESAKYRIYADWVDATNYHTHGLESLRRRLGYGDS